jgi:hypothetical protein
MVSAGKGSISRRICRHHHKTGWASSQLNLKNLLFSQEPAAATGYACSLSGRGGRGRELKCACVGHSLLGCAELDAMLRLSRFGALDNDAGWPYLRACVPCASCALAQRDCCTAAEASTSKTAQGTTQQGAVQAKRRMPHPSQVILQQCSGCCSRHAC